MILNLLASPEAWLAVFTLTMLEIVLGIDNIIFITLLVNKLPEHLKSKGRTIGLSFAMVTRIGLLTTLSWMASLTEPLIFNFSGRDLILILGGGFLVYKSLSELLSSEKPEDSENSNKSHANKKALFWFVMAQIAVIDIVFSLDSIITAVGLVNEIPLMICAVVLSVCIMMFALKPISDLLDKYPSFKIMALCFLILVGASLMLEGFEIAISKSYIYVCMGFAMVYEMFRLKSVSK